jgi:molybdopterin converting factor small subunit
LAGKIVVKFYGLLRRQVQAPAVEIEAADMAIRELLLAAQDKTGRGFLEELLDRDKGLLNGTMILVNGENIRLKQGLETRVAAGDTVDLFAPAGGG